MIAAALKALDLDDTDPEPIGRLVEANGPVSENNQVGTTAEFGS